MAVEPLPCDPAVEPPEPIELTTCCAPSIATSTLCRDDRTAVLAVVRSGCVECGEAATDPEVVGWLDAATGAFTPGPLPADVGPCDTGCVDTVCRQLCDDTDGDGEADATYSELWCIRVDGTAELVLTYQDDPTTPYTPVSPVECTYGCPESETVPLCDIAPDGTVTPFLRRYQFLAGTATYEDVALDGQTPHVVTGTVGVCAGGARSSPCEEQTTPAATLGLCLADGTPIAVLVTRDCDGTVTQDGWLNLTTGTYSAGDPPAGTMACGNPRSITTAGTFCDVAPATGDVLGLVLIEYTYGADGSVGSVRLVDAITGTTYTPQGEVTTCPAGVEQPERDLVELCDTAADGAVTPFLRDYARDENGQIVGHSDYALDGAPYVPAGTVGMCNTPCQGCETLPLCDVPGESTIMFAGGSTLDNGVTFTLSGAHSTVFAPGGPAWWNVAGSTSNPGGALTLGFDQPVNARWSVRLGSLGAANGCLVMPEGTIADVVDPLHTWDPSTWTLCANGSTIGTQTSTFHIENVSELVVVGNPPSSPPGAVGRRIGNVTVEAVTPIPWPFLRTICRDCDGTVTGITDTLLDGETAYTPVGTVGVCQAATSAVPDETPCRDVSNTLLCDVASLDTVTALDTVNRPDADGWQLTSFTDGGCTGYNPPDGPVPGPPHWSAGGYLGARADRNLGAGSCAGTWSGYDTALVRWVLTKTFTASEDGTAVVTADAFSADGGARVRVNGTDVGLYGQWNQPAVGGSSQVPVTAGPNIIEIEVRDIGGPNWLRGRLDVVMNRTVQFLRKQITDCETGAVVSTTDTTLDGDPYTVTGDVGQCEPVAECCEQPPPEIRLDVETQLLCIRDEITGDVLDQVLVERVYDDQTGLRTEQRITDPTTGDAVELPAGAVLARCPSPDRITRQICVVSSGQAEFLTNAPNAASGVDSDWQWAPNLTGAWHPMYRVTANPAWTLTDPAPNKAHWVAPHQDKTVCSPTQSAPPVTATWYTRASWNLPVNVSPDSIRIAASVLNADNDVVQWRLNDGAWQPVGTAVFIPPAWSFPPTAVPGGRAGQNEVIVQIIETTPPVSCPSPNQAGLLLHVTATYDFEPRVWTQVIEDGRVYYLDENGDRQEEIPAGDRTVPCGGGDGECCPWRDAETQLLCDIAGDGTPTPFIRAYVYNDADPAAPAVIDTDLDGAPYEVAGTVGTCTAAAELAGGRDVELTPMCVVDNASGNVLQRVLAEVVYDTATGGRIGVNYVDPVTWGPIPIPGGAHLDVCPVAEPEECRSSSSLLLCDLPAGGEPDPAVTDIAPAPYYPYATGAPVTGAQPLWDGGALTIPAGSAPQPGQVGAVATLAATVQALRPACDTGTAHVTVSVLVEQTGPDVGCASTGYLRLFNTAAVPIALALTPANTPVGWTGTLTAEADVPAADLAAGNIAALIALDTYDDSPDACPGSPRNTGWQLSGFTATVAYEQTGCETQFLRTVTVDCETGAILAVTDTTLDGDPYTVTGEAGQCVPAGACCEQASPEPCRNTATLLVCDATTEATPVTPTVVDAADSGIVLGTAFPALPGTYGALWSGGTLQFPADPNGTAGDGVQVYRTAIGRITASPANCTGATGALTVSTRVTLNGPGPGAGMNGALRLYRGTTFLGQNTTPVNAPVGTVDTLTVTGTVTADDLASGDLYVVLYLETFHGQPKSWTADQFTVTSALDGCAVQFIRNITTDCETGETISVKDTTLDGEPYTVTGEVGQCQAGGSGTVPEPCRDTATLLLCDEGEQPEQTDRIVKAQWGQASGVLPSGVTWSVTPVATNFPGSGAQTWTFSEPARLRFAVSGLNGSAAPSTPTECIVMPAGVVLESLYANHSWDPATRTVCNVVPCTSFPDQAACQAGQSVFVMGTEVTSLQVTGDQALGLLRAVDWIDVTVGEEPTQFLRQIATSCETGEVLSLTDTTLDGQPYTVTGAVAQCTPASSGSTVVEPCGDTEVAQLCDLTYDPQAPIPTPAGDFALTGNVIAANGGTTLWFAQANQEANGVAELTVSGLLPAVMYQFRFASAWIGAGAPAPATNNAIYLLEILDGTTVLASRTRNVSNGSAVFPGGVLTEDLPPVAFIAPATGAVTIRFTDQTTGGPVNDRDLFLMPFEVRTAVLTLNSTPFLRRFTFDCDGGLTSTQDLGLDGATPYEVQGEAGSCSAADGPAAAVTPCDVQNVLEACRCDDADGDGFADTGYVELIGVDCEGVLTPMGTYLPDLSAPYTPVAPVDCEQADEGAPPAVGVQARRVELTAGASWSAAAHPTLQSVTAVAHAGTGTITTADGTSTLHTSEAATWSVGRADDALLTGPLTIAANTGTVTVTYTTGVQL